MTTFEKLKNTLVPSIYAGALGAGLFYFLYNDSRVATVPFGPFDLPVLAAVGSSIAIGNMAGEVLTQYVLPHIPKNEILAGYEEHIIPPALSGLAIYGALKLLVVDEPPLVETVLFGVGTSVGAKYVYGMIPL